jgi:signal transduction histidine kinase/CheY-like chemotaxis protein
MSLPNLPPTDAPREGSTGQQEGHKPQMQAALLLPLRALRRMHMGWWMVLLVVLAAWKLMELTPAPQDAEGVQWSPSQLLGLRNATGGIPAVMQPQPVTLPHSWQPNGLPPTGIGTYALSLTISKEASHDSQTEPWALHFERLSPAHRMWLNGKLLRSTLPREGWLALAAPQLLEVPGGLLKEGTNQLIIEVHCAGQGGLTQPILVRKTDLQPSFTRLRWLTRDLLVVLNICCITFSLFVVMLWWLRRQEAAAGLFGLLILVGGLRNCRYFVEGDLHLSANFDSWLYFVAHVITACVQGWFVMALTNRHWPAFNRVLWGVLLSFPTLAVLATAWDPGLTTVRNALQGALILLLLPSLHIFMQGRSTLARHSLSGLGIGWLVGLLASIHDFALGRMVGDVTFSFWLPWAIPMALPSFSYMVVVRIVRAFNDIEEVNQHLETKVAERTRELAAANAAKSHFLASASHDLRQPVAAIGLLTDLLQSRVTDPALRNLTDRLTRAVNSMESLLKGLLDLSRLDSGTIEVQRRRVMLQPLLEAVNNHEMESARRKGLRLRIRPTVAVVWTDPVLLEQILRNLIGNAIRHTAQGGVLVGMRRKGDSWVLQVWDSGPGIEPVDQQRIFEAFVQLSNPARERSQGLGLGLAIVERAAKLTEHTVTVHSVVGQGSVFSVTMPAATLVQNHPPAAAAAPAALRARRVLVVEDDRGLRDTLVSLLQSWGVSDVQSAGSLGSVVALPAGTWDLVVSDHRLGDGTGREVIAHLRQSQPALPALILTGDTSPEQLAALARSGLPVLHKPFRSEKMRAMVLETMARARRDDSV